MPLPNPLQSRGMLHDLGKHTARDIEGELKRVGAKCAMTSGHPQYEYWRKRRAELLKAAQRYRSLTETEKMVLGQEEQLGAQESDLSKSLYQALFD